jgi:hypothetical protein
MVAAETRSPTWFLTVSHWFRGTSEIERTAAKTTETVENQAFTDSTNAADMEDGDGCKMDVLAVFHVELGRHNMIR